MTTAIDCLVNVDFADRKLPDWMIRVKEDYFKAGDSFLRSPELPELLADMDANGVTRAILMTGVRATDDRAQRYAAAEPERFALAVGGFDLLRPMKALRALESFVSDHRVAYAVVGRRRRPGPAAQRQADRRLRGRGPAGPREAGENTIASVNAPPSAALAPASSLADRVYVLERGQVVLSGPVSEVRSQIDAIEAAAYLSAAPAPGG